MLISLSHPWKTLPSTQVKETEIFSLPLEDVLFLTRSFSGSLVFLGSERNLLVFAAACVERNIRNVKLLQTEVAA